MSQLLHKPNDEEWEIIKELNGKVFAMLCEDEHDRLTMMRCLVSCLMSAIAEWQGVENQVTENILFKKTDMTDLERSIKLKEISRLSIREKYTDLIGLFMQVYDEDESEREKLVDKLKEMFGTKMIKGICHRETTDEDRKMYGLEPGEELT